MKSLAFLDLETTDVNIKTARIIEIYIQKKSKDEVQEYHKVFNPNCEIKKSAAEVNGFNLEDLKDKPLFSAHAQEIRDFLSDCVLGGFNALKFDLPLLNNEFERNYVKPIDLRSVLVIDPCIIYQRFEPRSLSAAVRFFLKRHHDGAHSAKDDTLATIDVLNKQIEYYGLPKSMMFLDAISRVNDNRHVDQNERLKWNSSGQLVINFGKYKGTLFKDKVVSDPEYFDYLLKEERKKPLNPSESSYAEYGYRDYSFIHYLTEALQFGRVPEIKIR